MRAWLLKELLKKASHPDFVFLTGDLGFHFLEPLREAMGPRFLNAGVAEQNMVSVAAGLAREGFRPFCYSISPFLYARAFEQIRIDLVLNRLPVQLIGSGAGFDYGSMGPEHHALEDYGTLLTLGDFTVHAPWCEASLTSAFDRMWNSELSSYLRLDRRAFEHAGPFAGAWHRLLDGNGDAVLCVGSTVGVFHEALANETARPSLWALDRLPFPDPPPEFFRDVKGRRLFVVEEHAVSGGAGQRIASTLFNHPDRPARIELCGVTQAFTGLFGDRFHHWRENFLLPDQVKTKWEPTA